MRLLNAGNWLISLSHNQFANPACRLIWIQA